MEAKILNENLLTTFCCELRRREKTEATVEKYRRDTKQFAGWAAGRPVTEDLIGEWKQEMIRRYSPGTVNGKVAAVNALFQFLRWGYRLRSLRLQRRAFRDDARELTRGEFFRLVETAQRTGRERLALILETIGGTGIRVSEVKNITVEALKGGKAEIALKGKIRTILLPGKLCKKLLQYARKQKIASGEIFLTRSGASLSRKQIWAEMKALSLKARVQPGKVFPHNLRHLFAQAFYKQTRDVVKLADVLGHSNLSTTRIYLLTTGAEHRRELEKLGLVG